MKKLKFNYKYVIPGMFLVAFSVIGLSQWVNQITDVGLEKDQVVIAIDAGHGGFDPGKVGVNDAKEKDINLSISLKLKELLYADGIQVMMTRETDEALHGEGEDRASKQSDMRRRVETINESGATIAVSIHQNSFTESSSHGAQVFYHSQSEEGKNLAVVLQAVIKESIADGNHREAKSNDSYYMLKNTKCPLVIVECGFLSNGEEANLLITEEYQAKMAEAIAKGIKTYLKDYMSVDLP